MDHPQLARAIGAFLVRQKVLSPAAASLIPTEAQLADQLERLTRGLDRAYGTIGPAHCSLLEGRSARLRISCIRFIDCAGACLERSAVLTLTVTRKGTRLTGHDWRHTGRGACGFCTSGF